MATIQGCMACSLDGFAADAAGGLGWLAAFEAVDAAAGDPAAGVVVLGRRTHDQLPQLGGGWPYPCRTGLVVTSGPGSSRYGGVAFWRQGLTPLIAHLRDRDDGEAWVVGGATLLAAMLAAGGLDRLRVFVAPVLLGEGTPLFTRAGAGAGPRAMALSGVAVLDRGLVRLDYAPGPLGRRRRRAA